MNKSDPALHCYAPNLRRAVQAYYRRFGPNAIAPDSSESYATSRRVHLRTFSGPLATYAIKEGRLSFVS